MPRPVEVTCPYVAILQVLPCDLASFLVFPCICPRGYMATARPPRRKGTLTASDDDAAAPASVSTLPAAEGAATKQMAKELDDVVAKEMADAFDAHDAQILNKQHPEELALGAAGANAAVASGVGDVGGAGGVATSTQQESAGDAELAAPLAGDPAAAVMCFCTKCKLDKKLEGLASPGPHFVCRQCNCKRSTLSQLFGYWPVELFTALPEEQQIEFWRSEAKGRLGIQNALVMEVANHREDEQKTSVGGKYLPLEVWGRKGFDIEKIKAECTDTEEHPIFGTRYNVGLKKVTKDEIKKQVWRDLFKASGDESAKAKTDKQKKKKKKKKNKKASSSSSSSPSSSSSSSTRVRGISLAEKRRADAEKRRADAVARKEAERLEKETKAAAAKAAKEAEQQAREEAKEKHKLAMSSQAAYTRMFAAHAKLVADCHVVPIEKQSGADFATAMAKVSEGEGIISDCLDAMKEKNPIPHDEVKAYIQSLKPVTSALAKLLPKRQRR